MHLLMRYAAPVSSLILLFGAAACQRRITDANIDAVNNALDRKGNERKIETGLSPKEVESILGQPDESKTSKKALVDTDREIHTFTHYIYRQDGQTIVLHFYDDKLIAPV